MLYIEQIETVLILSYLFDEYRPPLLLQGLHLLLIHTSGIEIVVGGQHLYQKSIALDLLCRFI